MAQLVTLLFALMGSDEELEPVLEQQSSGDVRAEVTASSPERVGIAAIWGFWVTPQYVYNLSGEADRGTFIWSFSSYFFNVFDNVLNVV